MLVVCRSCARQLRVFNLSGGAWGHCKTGSQLAALYIAVRSKTTEPEGEYHTKLTTCIYMYVHVYTCMYTCIWIIIMFIIHTVECPKTPVGDARKGVTGAMFSTASAAAPLEQQSPHCLYDATKHTPEVTVNRLTSGELVGTMCSIVIEAGSCGIISGSLESLMEGFCQRPGVQLAAVDMGIPG